MPTVKPGVSRASPVKPSSTPAMIRSSDDLPAPFAPSTPILAPGKNDSEMSFSTSLSGGWNRLTLRMVKMNCALMRATVPARPVGHGAWGADDRGPVPGAVGPGDARAAGGGVRGGIDGPRVLPARPQRRRPGGRAGPEGAGGPVAGAPRALVRGRGRAGPGARA